MRWVRKSIRYIKRFALFPIEINGETRWLETVYIKQLYVTNWWSGHWVDTDFVSKERYKDWKRERRLT